MNKTTMDNIRNMSEEEKLRICYNGYKEEFLEDGDTLEFDEYECMTYDEYYDIKDCSVYGSFEEYLNALTYDYMNDLIGTPFAI